MKRLVCNSRSNMWIDRESGSMLTVLGSHSQALSLYVRIQQRSAVIWVYLPERWIANDTKKLLSKLATSSCNE
jgi:hypothetical protein